MALLAAVGVVAACSSFTADASAPAPGDDGGPDASVPPPPGSTPPSVPPGAPPPKDAASTTPYFDAVMADGPIAYWRMDTTVGNNVIADKTVSHRDLALGAGVTLGVPGATKSEAEPAIAFDGVNGYAALDSNASTAFAFASASDHFTIEVWARRETPDAGPSSYAHVLGYSAGNGTNRVGYILYYTAANDTMSFEYDDGNANILLASTGGDVQIGAWHLWTVTKAGASLILYRDGLVASQKSAPTAMGTRPSASFVVGRDSTTGVYNWPGEIDEIAIFDKALGPSTIGKHYKAAGY